MSCDMSYMFFISRPYFGLYFCSVCAQNCHRCLNYVLLCMLETHTTTRNLMPSCDYWNRRPGEIYRRYRLVPSLTKPGRTPWHLDAITTEVKNYQPWIECRVPLLKFCHKTHIYCLLGLLRIQQLWHIGVWLIYSTLMVCIILATYQISLLILYSHCPTCPTPRK